MNQGVCPNSFSFHCYYLWTRNWAHQRVSSASPKTLSNISPCTMQIATFQKLGVPYASTKYHNFLKHLAMAWV
jgi:hypothetical protein